MLPHEPEALGIVLSGPLEAENWTGAGRPTDFYTLKGVVEAALRALSACDGEFAPLGDAAAHFPYLHPGKAALVSVPGAGGVGRPRACCARTWPPPTASTTSTLYFAALNLDRIAPVALRDGRVRGPRHVPAGRAGPRGRRRPRRAGGRRGRRRRAAPAASSSASVRVFDVYEGDQVPADKRSLALRVVMRSPERTLSEKDIAGVRAKILKALEREFQARHGSRGPAHSGASARMPTRREAHVGWLLICVVFAFVLTRAVAMPVFLLVFLAAWACGYGVLAKVYR